MFVKQQIYALHMHRMNWFTYPFLLLLNMKDSETVLPTLVIKGIISIPNQHVQT
jgi:hypothetical protein